MFVCQRSCGTVPRGWRMEPDLVGPCTADLLGLCLCVFARPCMFVYHVFLAYAWEDHPVGDEWCRIWFDLVLRIFWACGLCMFVCCVDKLALVHMSGSAVHLFASARTLKYLKGAVP